MLCLQKGLFIEEEAAAYCHTCSTLCNTVETYGAQACILEHMWQLQNACWLSTCVFSVQKCMMCCCRVVCLRSCIRARAHVSVSLHCFCVCASAAVPWLLLFVLVLCSQSMTRVGHTSRDTCHSYVSLRVHCQLFGCLACPLSSLLLRCTRSTVSAGRVDRSKALTSCTSPVVLQLKATSSNRLTMTLSKSYRASIMPCLIFVTFLF